jgi:thiamine kinase-like enzyme
MGEVRRPDAPGVVPADVAALVRSVPEWEGREITISPLEGGITNRNYRVDVGNGSFVIRLPGDRTELLGIDRAGEVEAARRAAHLGIGPRVVGVLPAVGTVITEFVEGEALVDASQLLAAERLETVVDAVAALHRSGPLGTSFPIFRIIEQHTNDAVAHGAILPGFHAELAGVVARIEAVFAGVGGAAVPCHNDLLPANLLFAGDRLWLIDYEYAGMNLAMFDLANLSVNAGFDADADDRLLDRYVNRPPSDAARAQLALMKVVSEMREGMWALVQLGISDLAGFDFDRYAAERLQSCRARVTSRDFAAALAAAVA